MKVLCLPASLLPPLVLACTAVLNCSAQQVALVNSPAPAVYSESAAPDPSASGSPYADPFAVIRAPQPAVPAKPPHLNLLDWSGIAAGATLRVLDYTTTEKALAHPQYFHEDILPTALVKNKPAFAAFQAGTVALNYEAYRLLVRHNMRPLAQVSQYLYLGIMTAQVSTNYQTLGKIPGE